MTFTPHDIDAIVAQVLAQLQPAPAAASCPGVVRGSPDPAQDRDRRSPGHSEDLRSGAVRGQEIRAQPGVITEVVIDDAVITGELLESKVTAEKRVRVRPGAVLTPSAKDVLRVRKIELVRGTTSTSSSAKAKWLAISSKATASVPGVIEQLKAENWEHRLSGTGTEAVRQAVSALCTAESAGTVVLTGEPEIAACLANRNVKVRAATAESVDAVQRMKKTLQPNLLAIDPTGRSFFELRNLFRAFSASVPGVPAGWSE